MATPQSPQMCLVIPYRDRADHLAAFLPHMRKFLSHHDVNFVTCICEQVAGKPFNRGLLCNIGFLCSQECDYFCFHDVDMLPDLSGGFHYGWPERPAHLAAFVEQFRYERPYPQYCGGVVLFSGRDYLRINGHSCEYWGWGAEDDDLLFRCLEAGLQPEFRPGRYQSLPHPTNETTDDGLPGTSAVGNRRYFRNIRRGRLITKDGLSTVRCKIVRHREPEIGMRHLVVDI